MLGGFEKKKKINPLFNHPHQQKTGGSLKEQSLAVSCIYIFSKDQNKYKVCQLLIWW